VTVRARSGQQPNAASFLGILSALNRYWTITGPGSSFAADLTFQYLGADVVGDETIYELERFNGSWSNFFGSLNTVTHTVSSNNVSSVTGDWTLISADGDSDGMPDRFEDAYGLNKFDASDASTDVEFHCPFRCRREQAVSAGVQGFSGRIDVAHRSRSDSYHERRRADNGHARDWINPVLSVAGVAALAAPPAAHFRFRTSMP
jgi:hypothetical protein